MQTSWGSFMLNFRGLTPLKYVFLGFVCFLVILATWICTWNNRENRKKRCMCRARVCDLSFCLRKIISWFNWHITQPQKEQQWLIDSRFSWLPEGIESLWFFFFFNCLFIYLFTHVLIWLFTYLFSIYFINPFVHVEHLLQGSPSQGDHVIRERVRVDKGGGACTKCWGRYLL